MCDGELNVDPSIISVRSLVLPVAVQVIVAQMEVYEKTLKRAQRRLLRKAEWGEAVLPQTEVRKCLRRLRSFASVPDV